LNKTNIEISNFVKGFILFAIKQIIKMRLKKYINL